MRIVKRYHSNFPTDERVISWTVKQVVETFGDVETVLLNPLRLWKRMEIQDFHATQAFHFGDELEQYAGQRMAMGRVDVEFLGTDQHILRVGRLKNGHSTRLEHSERFIE